MGLSRLSIFKLVELVLTVTCLVMHYNSMIETSDRHSIMIINGTFVGFTLILGGIFAGFLVQTPVNKRLDIFYSLVGAALFIYSGILIISYWNESVGAKVTGFFDNDRKSVGLTKGGLAIVNGVVFLADVFFTFRD